PGSGGGSPVREIPEEVRALSEERERARDRKDFAEADALRDRIREAGFEVTDTPSGPALTPGQLPPNGEEAAGYALSEDVPSLLEVPPTADVSVQWVVQGWPEDVRRGIEG